MADFYLSVFPEAKIRGETPMVVTIEIFGEKLMLLNAGDNFKFNESVSFVVECETQEEIDSYWNKLTADGGMEQDCGWCKDKYGLSWQVVPTILGSLMSDPAKAPAVMEAFMKMKKFDIEKLSSATN